jgi:hypothetical protein
MDSKTLVGLTLSRAFFENGGDGLLAALGDCVRKGEVTVSELAVVGLLETVKRAHANDRTDPTLGAGAS